MLCFIIKYQTLKKVWYHFVNNIFNVNILSTFRLLIDVKRKKILDVKEKYFFCNSVCIIKLLEGINLWKKLFPEFIIKWLIK